MGQLFAFQYEMVSKKETGSATGLTEGILPFSADTIQSGGSIVDTLAHICYELGTSETGVNIVKIPPSKSGQYCNINTQTSAKRTCAENLSDIREMQRST